MTVGAGPIASATARDGARLSDLDPDLPGMATVVDPQATGLRFQREWPGPVPMPTLTECVPLHVRWVPGVECVATYRLVFAPSHAGLGTTLAAVILRPDQDRHLLYDADPELPGLAATTDPAIMGPWFAERLGRPVVLRSIEPVSYRPGRRCVLRYRLTGGTDAMVLYGKVLPGDAAAELASAVIALADRGDPLVPAVVAAAPEWGFVVQADAGRSVAAPDRESVLVDDPLDEIDACGALTAALHQQDVAPGRTRSLAADAEHLFDYLPAVHRVDPASAQRYEWSLDQLRASAGPVRPTGPSHGALRLDQMRFGDRGPAFIDLDSFCRAEPARDVGNVLAYLRWRAIREPGAAETTARIRAAFLAGYDRTAASPLDRDRLTRFEAASLLKIAGRRYRRLAFAEWDHVPRLLDVATTVLAAGS